MFLGSFFSSMINRFLVKKAIFFLVLHEELKTEENMYRYLENTKKRVKCKKILLLLFQRGSLCSFHIEWCSCTFDNSHHNHLFSIKVFCPMTRVYFFFDGGASAPPAPPSLAPMIIIMDVCKKPHQLCLLNNSTWWTK